MPTGRRLLSFIRRHAGARQESATIAALSLCRDLPASWRVRCRALPMLCRVAALGAIVAAVVDPSCARSVAAPAGLDVMFLFDVSQSMRGMDIEPDRLQRAQAIVSQAVDGRPADRTGILLFAGDHALACPLTSDHEAFRTRLQEIVPSDSEGTAIHGAVVTALGFLRRARAQSGVLVMVTDGVSTEADANLMDAAARAFEASIPIVIVQTGSGGPVPMPTEFGTVVVETDDQSQALAALARRSGGAVIDAKRRDAGRALDAALAAFDRQRTVLVRTSAHAGGRWAGVALSALCAHVLLASVLRLRC